LTAADGPASHLTGVDRLTNTFSIMRHGQSKANVAGIIVSCIENDLRGDYGLSELGRAQALEAAQACGLATDTVIFSSDFSRARQTAEIVRAHLAGGQSGDGAPRAVLRGLGRVVDRQLRPGLGGRRDGLRPGRQRRRTGRGGA